MTTFSTPDLEPYLVLAQELMRHVYAEDSPDEIHQWLEAQLARLSGKSNETARLMWQDSFDYYEQLMQKRIEEAALPESERKILSWPWPSWSKYLDPLEPGMLAVLAAGDGMGKTLVAECLAEHWARQGRHVVFLHFELNRILMLDRRTVRHTGIARRTLRLGKLSPLDEEQRQKANARMRQWAGGITYVHTPGWSIARALSEVRTLIAEDLCDVFVVDYLEKAAASPQQLKAYATNIYAREANDVEQVKSFSEQQETPALILAQLNKIGKGQQFDKLDRTAIRGAGEKTEKANIVIMLHRDDADDNKLHVRIDKNTIGPTGSLEQYFVPSRFMIKDLAE